MARDGDQSTARLLRWSHRQFARYAFVYQLDDVTPMHWTVVLNTSPDWDYGSCSSATSVPAATKYWCLLQGNRVSENNGAALTNPSTSNSIFTQMRAVTATRRSARSETAADLWSDQIALPCNLDVNGAGNGCKRCRRWVDDPAGHAGQSWRRDCDKYSWRDLVGHHHLRPCRKERP